MKACHQESTANERCRQELAPACLVDAAGDWCAETTFVQTLQKQNGRQPGALFKRRGQKAKQILQQPQDDPVFATEQKTEACLNAHCRPEFAALTNPAISSICRSLKAWTAFSATPKSCHNLMQHR